jgi:hypothetical protein
MIVKLAKLLKFDFYKKTKNYKNSIFGSIEPNREKQQKNAKKIRVWCGRTFPCFIRYGSDRKKSS